MASLVLSGNTSGSVTISSPAVSGTTTLTLPTSSGTVTVAGVNSNIVSSTSQATTSGTSKDFTGIPSWVKRITVMFSGVSTNGTSNILLQIGDSGGIENTGYAGGSFNAVTGANSTIGFDLTTENIATATWNGSVTLTLLSGNLWTESGVISSISGGYISASGGSKTLSDVLDRVRITTVTGTNTFDAGTINILYE